MASTNMQSPILANAKQRLAALRRYEILDTAPEIDFDIHTQIAFHALNTATAAILLRDSDRLWLKSRIGRGIPQLHRQIAFCANAIIHAGEPLVVEDLTLDPRFQNNPIVIDSPNLRFYAGMPMENRNGYIVGTTAIVDTVPR